MLEDSERLEGRHRIRCGDRPRVESHLLIMDSGDPRFLLQNPGLLPLPPLPQSFLPLPAGPFTVPHSPHSPLRLPSFLPSGEHRPRDQGADQDQPAGCHGHVLRRGPGEDAHPDGEGLLPALPEVTRLPGPGCPSLGPRRLSVQLQLSRALTHLSLVAARSRREERWSHRAPRQLRLCGRQVLHANERTVKDKAVLAVCGSDSLSPRNRRTELGV